MNNVGIFFRGGAVIFGEGSPPKKGLQETLEMLGSYTSSTGRSTFFYFFKGHFSQFLTEDLMK